MLHKATYYADEWMCEMPGVAGSLAKVAQQLANGVKSIGGDHWWVEPQKIPSDHTAVEVLYVWVPCKREGATYLIPEDLPGEIHAVAYGYGKGWSPDDIAFDREDVLARMREGGADIEYLVCRKSDTPGVLKLRPGPVVTFEAAI